MDGQREPRRWYLLLTVPDDWRCRSTEHVLLMIVAGVEILSVLPCNDSLVLSRRPLHKEEAAAAEPLLLLVWDETGGVFFGC